jgi:hypothetical protein
MAGIASRSAVVPSPDVTRPIRLAAALLIAVALAPATWLGERPKLAKDAATLRFDPIAASSGTIGPFTVEGVWRMSSPHFWFGSYSALVALGDGTLLAGSDRGWTLAFAPPGRLSAPPRFAPFFEQRKRRLVDLEALARDPDSGTVWAAYEYRNAIVRRTADGAAVALHPPAMRRWPFNGGAEAMARLADGRFVVVAESASEEGADSLHRGLMFAGDPVERGPVIQFALAAADGYRPVDMAPLPDGRVMILLRRVEWTLPPGFTARLAIADPREIREGGVWRAKTLVTLTPPLSVDNYEGLAVESGERGSVILWLISDNNRMAIQRTLLMKLRWTP